MNSETKEPLVSVIMPCYKMGRFIGEALESVGKQTYTNWEVIAVDDCGPEDGTKEEVEGFAKKYPSHRVIYNRHETNSGVSDARNTAIGLARGEYLAFLDPDDTWHAVKLEYSVAAFSKSKDIVLYHHPVDVKQIKTSNSPFEDVGFKFGQEFRIYRLTDERYFLEKNDICTSTVVVSKEIFEKIMFPIGMVFQFEDWVAWCLLGNHGRFAYQPAVLATYRFHGDSFTHKQMQNQKIKSFAHLEALLCIFTRSRNKAIMVKLGNKFIEVLLLICYKSSENWQLQQKSVEKTSFVNLVFKSIFRKKLLNLFLLIKGI